jgi:hypothetical protein
VLAHYALDEFQAGLLASHDDGAAGGASINTVVEHSYGSTLVESRRAKIGGRQSDN